MASYAFRIYFIPELFFCVIQNKSKSYIDFKCRNFFGTDFDYQFVLN